MSSLYTDEFTTDREGVHDMLLCHGVAVIPGVMSEKECADASLNLWGEFETVFQAYPTPLSRRDPSTWKQCLLSLRPHHRMLFQSVICHSQTVWDVRQNYEIFKIFQSIYDCKCRMLVSFDGLSFLPAPERGGYGFSDGEQRWFHVDQSLKTHGFKCVQGFVTLQPVDEGDATLGVVAGSHMLHDKFLQEHHGWLPKSRKLMNADELKHDTKLDKDWYPFNEQELEYFKTRHCRELYIKAPAGSLVLWDSRTVHMGKNPDIGRPHQHDRMVVYVCMMPTSKCPEEKRLLRIKRFEERRGTSHWPYKVSLFQKAPWTRWGGKLNVTELPPPVLNDHGRRLVGYIG